MTTTNSISKILVPLDTSEVAERAIPWAKAVAGDRCRDRAARSHSGRERGSLDSAVR